METVEKLAELCREDRGRWRTEAGKGEVEVGSEEEETMKGGCLDEEGE
jgi:hypothetical protein